jgi:PKHD-type hydroxylase
VLAALSRHPLFFSAALPRRILPPMFNRYAARQRVRQPHRRGHPLHPRHARRAGPHRHQLHALPRRPDEYDGGELVIEDTYGAQRVKLPAGDLVLYPGTSVHRVEPVTRGARLASFFWVESMVRSDEQRSLLHDMDTHLMHLRETVGETEPAVIGLTGTYHNLLRLWADV